MSQYRIHPMAMGSKVFDKSMMTYQFGYGSPYTIPIYCWYLEGGNQKILIDTGEMSPIESEDRESSIGGPIYTFEEGLAKWGLKPEEIDVVIHTHLHNDHCENDFKCVNARFYIHEKELTRIHEPHPLDFPNKEFISDVEENGQIEKIVEDQENLTWGPGGPHSRSHRRRAFYSDRHACSQGGDYRFLRHHGKFFSSEADKGHGDGSYTPRDPCKRLSGL